MNTTISIAIEDFKNQIINDINSSGLPPCIVELVFKNILNDIEKMSRQQYEKEKMSNEKNKECKGGDKNENIE